MNRILQSGLEISKKLLLLSTEGTTFFCFSVALHLAFKMCLGLFVTIVDGYGFASFVAPPQSLLFVTSDIVFSYALARGIDLLPQKKRKYVYLPVFATMFVFLLLNFMVHMHFKAFVKYSLILFNGAGTAELTEYFWASLNYFSVPFIVVSLLLSGAWIGFANKLQKKMTGARTLVPAIAALISLGIWQGLDSRLSAGQECWMLGNPVFEFVESTVEGVQEKYRLSKLEKQMGNFQPPTKPVFGKYPPITPVDVAAVQNANVLFLLLESVPANKTILSGDQKSPLRVFERLKGSSIAFTNTRTIFPATSRSFISYHCGTYPGTDASTISKYKPDFNCQSIVALLKRSGYRTAFFTPSMFSYDNLHTTRMMDAYDLKKHFFDFQKDATSSGLLAQAVEEELVAQNTLEFMTSSSKPFFALYFSFWTHAPYRLPNRDISHLDLVERYYLTLEYMDGVFNKLLDDMESAGLLKNTIIVFASDHGEAFGDLHAGNYNHGGMVFEENTHIPFFVYVPGLNRQIVVDRQGTNVDFAPTLAALLGIAPERAWEGQNLLGDAYVAKPHLLFSRSSTVANGIVDGNLKYFYYGVSDKDYLYDLDADKTERHNIALHRSREVKYYRDLVDKWLLFQNKKINDSQK